MDIKNFEEISIKDVAQTGGKGASLGEMTQAGILVPPGFVILSSVFDRFINESGLVCKIDSILATVDNQKISTVDEASKAIQDLINSTVISENISKEIYSHFKDLNAAYVAVRSSATAEDGIENAWAGQLDSFLNITENDLLDKVKCCWASLFTSRAIFYRFEKGLDGTVISVAVVVQKMVNSEVSGIAFSVHPVTNNKDQIIIEAGFGLGEAIVSGQINPDSYVVEKAQRKIVEINIETQTRGLYRVKKGGNEWIDISEPEASSQVLSDSQISVLSDLIIKIENHYGFPCDIEWAFEKGLFYVVQSRPITTLIENSSEKVVSEDFWVLAQEIPKMHIFFFHMVYYMVNWWPKYNLTKSFDEAVADFEGTHVKLYCKNSKYSKAALEVAEKILNNPNWALKQLYKIELLSKEYIRNTDKLIGLLDIDKTKQLKQFEKCNKYSMESQVLGAAFTWLTDARYELIVKRLIEIIQEQITLSNSKENPIYVFNVLTKSGKKSHSFNEKNDFLEIIRMIQANSKIKTLFLEKLEDELTQYVLKKEDEISIQICDMHAKWCWLSYGYTGPEKELLEYIKEIKIAIQSELSPNEVIKDGLNNDAHLEDEQKKILSRLRFNKKQLGIINFVKESSYLKDYRKGAVYHGMYCYKRFFDSLSESQGIKSDLFWHMSPPEIEKLLKSNVRISVLELERRAKSCAVVYERGGVTFLFDENKQRMLDSMFMELEGTGATELKGMPVCMGFVVGKAKIIDSIDDLHKMQEGDILISHITYPNLLPAMKKASAIVTNIGGVICHAAIIARELNIPCIVGTKFATKLLKDGDLIEVDANNGKIKILKSNKKENV